MAAKLIWHRLATKHELDHGLIVAEQAVKTIEIEGKSICIGRFHGSYYALRDKCMHAGGSLGEGQCDGKGNVICPIHRYKYSMITGKNTSGEGYYALTYPLETREDGLYIGFENRKWWQIL